LVPARGHLDGDGILEAHAHAVPRRIWSRLAHALGAPSVMLAVGRGADDDMARAQVHRLHHAHRFLGGGNDRRRRRRHGLRRRRLGAGGERQQRQGNNRDTSERRD